MAGFKTDRHAVETWGPRTYERIPKSVFASLAWHLANVASGTCDAPGAAEARTLEELEALLANGILPVEQFKRARAAIRKGG